MTRNPLTKAHEDSSKHTEMGGVREDEAGPNAAEPRGTADTG